VIEATSKLMVALRLTLQSRGSPQAALVVPSALRAPASPHFHVRHMRTRFLLAGSLLLLVTACAETHGVAQSEADDSEIKATESRLAELEKRQAELLEQARKLGIDVSEITSRRRVAVSSRNAGAFQPYVDSCLNTLISAEKFRFPTGISIKHGSLLASITLGKTGEVVQVDVERTSGNPMLDESVILAIKKSSPCSPFERPVFEGVDALTIVVPLEME
jgi:hypothetical protein